MNSDLSKLLETGISMFTNEFQSKSTFPSYDIYYDSDTLLVILEIPGISKEDIKLDFFNNMLTVKGKKLKIIDKQVFQGEIFYGNFERHIQLPISVTSDQNVSIQLQNGLLLVTIDVAKELKNKFTINLK
jgi:HSP20 family protein